MLRQLRFSLFWAGRLNGDDDLGAPTFVLFHILVAFGSVQSICCLDISIFTYMVQLFLLY